MCFCGLASPTVIPVRYYNGAFHASTMIRWAADASLACNIRPTSNLSPSPGTHLRIRCFALRRKPPAPLQPVSVGPPTAAAAPAKKGIFQAMKNKMAHTAASDALDSSGFVKVR